MCKNYLVRQISDRLLLKALDSLWGDGCRDLAFIMMSEAALYHSTAICRMVELSENCFHDRSSTFCCRRSLQRHRG